MSQSKPQPTTPPQATAKPNMFMLFKDYKLLVGGIVVFSLITNGLNLLLPKIMGWTIDSYIRQTGQYETYLWQFGAVVVGIMMASLAQMIIQTITAEKVAYNLRNTVAEAISRHSYPDILKRTPATMLTNLTSDINSIKELISMAISSIISSIILIFGSGFLLLHTNWKLGLVILLVIPIIGGMFFVVFRQANQLFTKVQGVIDHLNLVISQTILGSTLIRVLNGSHQEQSRFSQPNQQSKDLGIKIVGLFSFIIPSISFIASLAILTIMVLGGHFIIEGSMTIGDLTAFNSYLGILIFPIIMLGFMSSIISRAAASYARVADLLVDQPAPDQHSLDQPIAGQIEVDHISLTINNKDILKDVSFQIKPGQRIAIIGPTAAGKTQLLYALIGLLPLDHGAISYDGHLITDYQPTKLRQQVGLVFQDSSLFNASLRQNIAFSDDLNPISSDQIDKAIRTAELTDFVKSLPQGLDTVVTERGTSLSGGQKQRLMLARALALQPKILLLDDFTARVDNKTEQAILNNLAHEYPDLTIISVSQKISSIKDFDHILVLMEGELLAQGTHQHLLKTSPEYAQIYQSQRSMNQYELHA